MKILNLVKCTSLVVGCLLCVGCTCSRYCAAGPMASYGVALRDVHFAFDSADLTPVAKETLREDFHNLGLGASTKSKILLEGRADERGETKYNDGLSKRRVAAVKEFMLNLGAQKSQFETRGLGERDPIQSGSKPSAWAKNRSVRVVAM